MSPIITWSKYLTGHSSKPWYKSIKCLVRILFMVLLPKDNSTDSNYEFISSITIYKTQRCKLFFFLLYCSFYFSSSYFWFLSIFLATYATNKPLFYLAIKHGPDACFRLIYDQTMTRWLRFHKFSQFPIKLFENRKNSSTTKLLLWE